MGRFVLFSTLVLYLCLGTMTPAWAHASLVASAPADGAVLADAPSALSLTFDETVSPIAISLVKPNGTSMPLSGFTFAGNELDIPAPPGLGRGTQVLSWRVISMDGHPVGGSVVFSIGAPSAGAVAPTVADIDWWRRAVLWGTRVAAYVGLFFGVGGAAFGALIARDNSLLRRPIAGMLAVGIVSTAVSVGLQGLDVLDLPLTEIVRGTVWPMGMASSFGVAALIALASLTLGISSLVAKGRSSGILASLALGGVGASLAASGHASAADPQWLTRPAVFVHGVTVSFWLGSLLPLAVLLARRDPAGPMALRRFSDAILPSTILLLAAGLALAVVQIVSLDQLLSSDYGRLFVAKMVLVAGLLTLAALNRWRETRAATHGDGAAGRRLKRAIIGEIAIALALLGVVACWRFTPPPRALIAAARQPAFVHIHSDQAMAEVTVSPGHAGSVSVKVYVTGGDFGALPAQGVTLHFSDPAAGIEQIVREARLGEDGYWHVDALSLPVGGHWTIGLDVLESEFDMVQLSDQIDIRP